MVKRIFLMCLVALLCVPCLVMAASADTAYSFTTSADTDGIAVISGILPEGTYFLSGCGTLNGTEFSFENEPVIVSYFDDGGTLMSMSLVSFEIDGQTPYFVCVQNDGATFVGFGYDLGVAYGTFILSGAEISELEPVYTWTHDQGFFGYRFPPAGVYNVRVTYAGQVVESVCEVPEVSAGSYKYLSLPRFDVMPEGSNFYEGTQVMIWYLNGVSYVTVVAAVTEKPMEGATVEFIPVTNHSPPYIIFLANVFVGIDAFIAWLGLVVDALIGVDGALSVLLPFVGVVFCIGLIWAGVSLFRRFSP